MPPRDLVFEALSAITGCDVKSVKEFKKNNPGKPEPESLSPQDVVNKVLLSDLNELISRVRDLINSNPQTEAGKVLIDGLHQVMHGIKKLNTEAEQIRKELFINEDEFFDPRFDYDFTGINDGQAQFKRGNELYRRPCGWNRIALKVLNKYPDGNGWLGTGPHAWPVSYHGTSIEAAKEIIQGHYKAGPHAVFGRGVYSAPNIETAFCYSKTFTSKATKKTYHVILQNRINPSKRVKFSDYWLVPVPEGTSAAEEKEIVESAIRPYGLLLREVKPAHNLSG